MLELPRDRKGIEDVYPSIVIDVLFRKRCGIGDSAGFETRRDEDRSDDYEGALGRQTATVLPDPYRAASLAAGLDAGSSQYLTAASNSSLQTGDVDFDCAGRTRRYCRSRLFQVLPAQTPEGRTKRRRTGGSQGRHRNRGPRAQSLACPTTLKGARRRPPATS